MRLQDVEASIRRVRWVGALFAVVDLGLLYQPPAGIPVPFPRVAVALAFALTLAALNAISHLSERRLDPRHARMAGVAQLVADTALVVAMVALFTFDPDSRLWPLFVLPVLEGALREEVTGAVAVAAAGVVSEALIHWSVLHHEPARIVSASVFRAGILLIVALGAGFLARRFEQARAWSEQHAGRLRRLAELAGEVSAQRRTDDVLTSVLNAACELTGLDRGEVHARQEDGWVRRATAGEVPEGGATLLDRLLTADRRVEDVVLVADAWEESRDDEPLLVAPIQVDGDIAGLLVLASSDTRRRLSAEDRDVVQLLASRAAAALENARLAEGEARTIAELRTLEEMKGEFMHILAHELRGPMTAMTGYAAMLRTRWQRMSDERREEFLTGLEQGTLRMARLVSDVQDAIAAERDTLAVKPAAVELQPILEQLTRQEVVPSPLHRAELVLEPELPQVLADSDRVKQVVLNLLSNAVKYSPDGGRVRVSACRVGDRVAVAVTDDGVGIPTHLQRHLFGKFSRLPNDVAVKGTGLGLYLSRTLVEAMGGRIEVESEAGRGSTFRFTLPVAPSRRPTPETVAAAR